MTERPTLTVTSSKYTLRFVSVFIQCLVSVVSLWIPSSGPNLFFSSCWSRGTNLSSTRPFLMLANATCYPDGTLCSFYNASLNTTCRALSSEDGPRGDFAAYVEWTLARNGSPLTVCPEDDLARSTPDPEPSPPSPCGAPARAHR